MIKRSRSPLVKTRLIKKIQEINEYSGLSFDSINLVYSFIVEFCTNIVTIMINTRISKETVVKQLINRHDKYKKRLNQSLNNYTKTLSIIKQSYY